jgi:hypothetical protein
MVEHLLADDEIIKRLRTIRFSSRSERCARRLVSVSSIATVSGLSRRYLYRIALGERPGPRSAAILSRVLSDM